MRVSLAFAAVLLAAPLGAGEKAKSGCQPGEGMAAFQVHDITGKYKTSRQVCYI
jgi:hypothetical protein